MYKSIKKSNVKTPDFKVFNQENNETVYIEVNIKQCNEEESKKYKLYKEKINKNYTKNKNISAVIISEQNYTLYFENPFSNKRIPV